MDNKMVKDKEDNKEDNKEDKKDKDNNKEDLIYHKFQKEQMH